MSTFRLSITRLLFGLFLLLMLTVSGFAQAITGTISGTVLDPNKGVIPGAKVTLINDQTGDKRTINTNEEGRFTFAAVQPGVYTLKIEHQGFQTFLRQNTVLSANDNLAIGEITLTTGSVNETVTVTSEGAIVE